MINKPKKSKELSFPKFLKQIYNVDYGKGEIKTFSPQIKKAIRIAATHNLRGVLAKKKMKELGFKVKKSSGIAFIGETQVLKLMYESSMGANKRPDKKIRVPTVFLTDKGSYKIVVQSKAEIPKGQRVKDKIHDRFHESFKQPKNGIYDAHSDNIGLYNGKYVLFDW